MSDEENVALPLGDICYHVEESHWDAGYRVAPSAMGLWMVPTDDFAPAAKQAMLDFMHVIAAAE